MFRGFRLVVSVTAALPINARDGEAVYNFRGSVSTGHFLGQLFRTLNQVLNQSPDDSGQSRSDSNQITDDGESSSASTLIDINDDEESVEPRKFCRNQSSKKGESAFEKDKEKSKLAFSQQGSDEIHKKADEKTAIQSLDKAQPTCQNSSQDAQRYLEDKIVNKKVSKMIEPQISQSENISLEKAEPSIDKQDDSLKQILSQPASQKRKLSINLSQNETRFPANDKEYIDRAANQLNTAMKRCSLKEKAPTRSSTSSYSVMVCKRRQQKHVYQTEHIFPTCQKCRGIKTEELSGHASSNNGATPRRIQRRSWPLYSHSTSKKLSPPISPLKNVGRQSRSRSPSKRPKLKGQETCTKKPSLSIAVEKLPLTKAKGSLKKSHKRITGTKQPGDNISNYPFPPMPLTWRRSDRSIWDDSAAHLLDMTSNFLKQIPKNVKDDPVNRCIISRLFDLITDEMFFQTTSPNDKKAVEEETTGAVKSVKTRVCGIDIDNSGANEKEGDNYDVEISSSATIKWCCSIALHLLQLSLNVGNKTRRNDRTLDLKKLKSDD